jgi:hypothetical protein
LSGAREISFSPASEFHRLFFFSEIILEYNLCLGISRIAGVKSKMVSTFSRNMNNNFNTSLKGCGIVRKDKPRKLQFSKKRRPKYEKNA